MHDVLASVKAALAGRYAIERELGRGGMATVYLARDVRHDRDVAVKVLNAHVAETLGRERFEREIKLAARLTHPHILALFDSGDAGGFLFYVMPVMAGQTLRDRLAAGGPLAVEEAVRLTSEVADALDYAHRHEIVHRDIKPENILLHEGHAVVADFGIGKAIAAASTNTSASFTQAGMAIGTPAYMSPEQATGEAVDGRSDLFSLGCTLYEMLTGEPPFTGTTAQQVIAKRFTHTPPAVTSQRPAVPEVVSRTVEKLLEKAPEDRLTSGAHVVRALKGDVVLEAKRVVPSVAVLPFANMSADADNQFFSDGITDDIIGALTKVPGLRVAARASSFTFRGADVDLAAVGEKLGVRHVLQGSVRRAGNRVRVTAQLMATGDGTQPWSDRWDRDLDDIFAIQDEIAKAIVGELEVRLGVKGDAAAPLVRRPTEDMEAYDLFLRGREGVRRRTPTGIRTGIDALERALARDPGFALAWLGLAEAQAALAVYGYDSVLRCRTVAHEALAQARRLGATEADIARNAIVVTLYLSPDWPSVADAVERAVRDAPHDALTNVVASYFYALMGNTTALGVTGERASLADPLSAWAHAMVGHSWFIAGDHAQAIGFFERALAIDANSLSGSWGSALALSWLGRHDEALVRSARAVSVGEGTATPLAIHGHVLWRAGRHDEARGVADEVRRKGTLHDYAT
ncbi:MAG: protein kinase, partial [Gemmatimonadetes bacterium]|nr:protein kinase [Gemmatimonadota bacterium]